MELGERTLHNTEGLCTNKHLLTKPAFPCEFRFVNIESMHKGEWKIPRPGFFIYGSCQWIKGSPSPFYFLFLPVPVKDGDLPAGMRAAASWVTLVNLFPLLLKLHSVTPSAPGSLMNKSLGYSVTVHLPSHNPTLLITLLPHNQRGLLLIVCFRSLTQCDAKAANPTTTQPTWGREATFHIRFVRSKENNCWRQVEPSGKAWPLHHVCWALSETVWWITQS